jgi:hypothetical protein
MIPLSARLFSHWSIPLKLQYSPGHYSVDLRKINRVKRLVLTWIRGLYQKHLWSWKGDEKGTDEDYLNRKGSILPWLIVNTIFQFSSLLFISSLHELSWSDIRIKALILQRHLHILLCAVQKAEVTLGISMNMWRIETYSWNTGLD